jgi:DNA-directed RNA polymerase
MKETTKIKNSDGFWMNLITISHAKVKGTQRYVGVLKINEEFILSLLDQVEKKDSLFIQLDRSLPMIYKPAPWKDYEIGGYYQKPTNFMRIEKSGGQENAIKYADLEKMYKVLNIVGNVKWRVNKQILRVVEEIWNGGGGVGTIPLRYYNYRDFVYDFQLNECKFLCFGEMESFCWKQILNKILGKDVMEKRRLAKRIQKQRDVHS